MEMLTFPAGVGRTSSDESDGRTLAGWRGAGIGEAERRADEPVRARRRRQEHRLERDHERGRVDERGSGADSRHQAEVVLRVPEPEPARGVKVREGPARHNECGEAQHQEERLELRHGVATIPHFTLKTKLDSTRWPSTESAR